MQVSGYLHALADLPQKRTPVPTAGLDFWTGNNLLPLPGFKPQTAQPVA